MNPPIVSGAMFFDIQVQLISPLLPISALQKPIQFASFPSRVSLNCASFVTVTGSGNPLTYTFTLPACLCWMLTVPSSLNWKSISLTLLSPI